MTIPQRIKVKYFVQEPAAVDLDAVIPVFHHWIQDQRVEGLLLDVADYKHMQNGPGVLLIGHEADYALDMADGRPGLTYDRKRQWAEGASLADRLRVVLRNALHGCQTLQSEPNLNGRIHFRLDEVEVTLLDRLRTPNDAAVYARVQGEVQGALDEVYGAGAYTLERSKGDPREPLTIHVKTAGTADLGTLLGRVGA